MVSLLHHDRTTLDRGMVERVVSFHGGLCPALALGIQAARVALDEVGTNGRDHEVHADSEDQTCGLDAVQYLTGCTLGNRDLRILSHGKFAFTFHRRSDAKTVRVAARPSAWEWDPEHIGLFARVQAGVATPTQVERFQRMHKQRAEAILEANPRDLFDITTAGVAPPARPYSPRPTVVCSSCAELVSSDHVREVHGRPYCVVCARSS